MPTAINRSPQTPRGRLIALAISLGILTALGIVELILQWRFQRIASSDQLDPGLIRRDPRSGWRMTPHWTGTHRHHDFSVRYATDALGYRVDPALDSTSALGSSNWVAFVGDSFTFGLGVQNDETFVSRLNQDRRRPSLNFGIPGYSTDQEILLIENEILPRLPRAIVLVVYLGNDLIDNLRFVPLQVGAPKPRFALTHQTLTLLPAPAPGQKTDPADPDPSHAVIGPQSRYAWRQWIETRSSLARFVSPWFAAPDLHSEFENRFKPALDLFDRLIERLVEACQRKQVPLHLALLGSSALIQHPGSVSSQYQQYFQREIHELAQARGIPVIDLAGLMQERWRSSSAGTPWFHPHEGHLTAEGHQVVAELLEEALKPIAVETNPRVGPSPVEQQAR